MAKVTAEICWYPDERPTLAYPECEFAYICEGHVLCKHSDREFISSCAVMHMFPHSRVAFQCPRDKKE